MRALVLLLSFVLGVASAGAQSLPSEPITFGDGRVLVGADVTATIAPEDPGFFNYTDYEYNALRNFRIGVSTEVRANDRLQLLAEVRVDHFQNVQPFAFYARIRPWPTRRLDIQVGRIPPTFGAMSRRPYSTDNLLIGQPLAYQYLTSLRADAIPASPGELLSMRGRGWLSSFSAGNRDAAPGVPLVNAFRWDTGIQVHGKGHLIEWTGAVTNGTLSNPRVGDDNRGKQFAGRVVLRAAPALALGLSGARGAFLGRAVAPALPAGFSLGRGTQTAVGIDAEYSVGRFLARTETIWSRWLLPDLRPGQAAAAPLPLDAIAMLVEGRYRLAPGIYAAARAERLEFSRITGETRTAPWDAPVQRLELGGGWSLRRNVLVKASWQRDTRSGGRVRRFSAGALQLLYWF